MSAPESSPAIRSDRVPETVSRVRRPRRAAMVSVPFVVLVVYGVPPLLYAALAGHLDWAKFWASASAPYGTVTAGMLAVVAAANAFYTGYLQRREEANQFAQRLEQDRSALRDSQRRAEEDRAAAKQEADRRHDVARDRDLRARLVTATQQLADEATTVQQSGVYSLAALADDWLAIGNNQEAQVSIDVLCTYLRTHHLGNFPAGQYDYSSPPPDKPVRDTILKIIANHLQPPDKSGMRKSRVSGAYALPNPSPSPGAWSHLDFDFDGAHFQHADLTGVYFAGIASFRSTNFAGNTLFRWAYFTRQACFDSAEFTGEAHFDGAHFADLTYFSDCRFTGTVYFPLVCFAGTTLFTGTHFDGETLFNETEFVGRTSFMWTYFSGATQFDTATFGEGESRTEFISPRAWNNVSFAWSDSPANKPTTVKPDEWPPAVVPELRPYKYPFPGGAAARP